MAASFLTLCVFGAKTEDLSLTYMSGYRLVCLRKDFFPASKTTFSLFIVFVSLSFILSVRLV